MEHAHPIQRVANLLQRSPGLRSTIYLGTAAALMQGIGSFYPLDYSRAVVYIHLTILPLGAALTGACLRLEGRQISELLPSRSEAVRILIGAGAGSIAYTMVIGVMFRNGWANAPTWGWEHIPVDELLRSVALMLAGHFAVAWNEEMVFRGYGFDTLRAALGTVGAAAILVPLFAAAHPLIPSALLGNAAAGILLTIMRLQSGSIWLGVGYHWAWNVMQTALFGPPEALPSLRPLDVQGPAQWVGRPGHPEPGLLTTFAYLAGAVVVGVAWWLTRKRAIHT